jgi:hypothetical protein
MSVVAGGLPTDYQALSGEAVTSSSIGRDSVRD